MRRVVTLLPALLAACSGDLFVTSRGDVDKANSLTMAGKFQEALTAYDALQLKSPRIDFDRGLAEMGLKQWEPAVSAFDAARDARDPSMKAASYYHIGNVHSQKAIAAETAADKDGALGAWKEAVAAYENALTIDPTHEKAKLALEVALYRVDPPCQLRNDAEEPNDEFGAAKPLKLAPAEGDEAAPGEQKVEQKLWLCPGDEDWYYAKLEPGDRLFASVKKADGPEHVAPAVEVWSADGKRRLRPPDGDAKPLDTLSLEEVATAGDYRIRVPNEGGDDFGATLEVSVRPECRRTEDQHEPNDGREAAKDVDPASENGEVKPLRLCPANEDWFAVPVGEGESLRVTAEAKLQKGELALTLVDAEGNVLGEGKKNDKGAVVALAYGRPAGKVYVKVSGSLDVEAVYALKNEVIPVCAKREDKEEENDTVDAAKDLAPGDHDGLQLCPRDPDVYRVTVKQGESVVAHLSAEPLQGTPALGIADASGKELAKGFTLEGGLLAVALDPGAGSYFVQVAGDDADAKYDLKIQVLPACPEGNDGEEKNDTPADAKTMELPEAQQAAAPPGGEAPAAEPPKPKQKLLRICPGDQDWFRIPVKPESQLTIASIEFVHDKGDLDLVLYEADGEKRAGESQASSPERNAEAVVVPPPEAKIPDPTDFLLKVAGANADTQNFYLLSLKPMPQGGKDQQSQGQDKKDQQKQEQKDQPKPEEQKPDRSAIEKEMENQDKNKRNLEAERAARKARHEEKPLKDW